MPRTMVIALMVAVIAAFAPVLPGESESGSVEWTKIVIKEAFISRQTSIDFRDPNSAAEFGWQVKRGGAFAARGGSLYATMYVPFGRPEPLRLFLVERDVFSDDIVSGVDLEQGKSRYVLNANGDFVVLERTPFYPDGRSGGDETPEKAAVVAGDMRGSVSFLDGDYTDCVKLPAGPCGVIIVASSASLSVDLPGGDMPVHPTRKGITSVYMIATESGGEVVRLKGAVGGSGIAYRILAVPGSKGFEGFFRRSVKLIAADNRSTRSFLCRDVARALLSLDREKTVSHCAGDAGKQNGGDCLCAAVNPEARR